MHLQDRRAPRASPSTRAQVAVIELVVAWIECQRVGAIGAAERTTVRQLGEKTERGVQNARCHSPPSQLQQLLVGEPAQHRRHVGQKMRWRGALKVLARSSTIASSVASPVAALDDLDGDRIGLERRASRRQQHPAALRFAVHQPDAARAGAGRASAGIAGTASLTILYSFGTKAPGGNVTPAPHRHDRARPASPIARRI